MTNERSSQNIDSLTAGEASIGTVSGQGSVFRLVGRQTPGSDTGTIQFTGLSNDRLYRVFYNGVSLGGAGTITARFNGDGGSTGNYEWWDESGTETTGANSIELVDTSDGTAVAGLITFTQGQFGADYRFGLNHQPIPSTLDGRYAGFAVAGTRTVAEALNSIELINSNDWGGGATVVELWERDYA